MRILLHQWLYRRPYLWLEVGFSRNRLASHILSLATITTFSDYLIACIPPIVGAGFLRLQLISKKEKASKEAHNQSAQIASEAVVAIRTVASLTCEDHMSTVYHKTLYRPPTTSDILSNIVGNAVFAFSLSAIFFAVALVFWYGSRLVASGEYSTFRFYVSFMVR